ncbi:predicted protein [Scheffersomyces stipitis CBS 6054]|uniref:Cell wall mannoprotein PIR1-like C-terminal domain-containing protein n=1 Tax=Scheffersomyces stipitis (strain ATCC 58785 / CBS 6054 / NBRC 10063 / NRRL Y-11545) TaxID=322104 RepID=A3LU05_PICST|nr:predicted protein [Scheffersomyces stipitis CBS 6054]ABN66501.1 predicted protein [Scheffersomyces stipitis CBS 6054]
MKYSRVQLLTALIGSSYAATIPSEPWTALTPSDAPPSGATTDHTHTFGIQIVTVTTSSEVSATSAVAKRDVVNQIGDGQIQKQTSETLATPTPTPSVQVINQIGDGQIQHQTTTAAEVINQIGDGQIQHQTTTAAEVINQIGDGQIQHQTTTAAENTVSIASQISDGQVQQPTDASSGDDDTPDACLTDNSLAMVLEGSVLRDSHGRVGAIVANRQFQFDGPPPQAGSIYAAGWSITKEGNLALGSVDTFYQCLSGDFYNLYDENVAAQCSPVKLNIVDLVAC